MGVYGRAAGGSAPTMKGPSMPPLLAMELIGGQALGFRVLLGGGGSAPTMKGPSMPPTLAMELMSATPMAAAEPLRKVAGSAEMMPASLGPTSASFFTLMIILGGIWSYLQYWTLNLKPPTVYPKLLLPLNFIINPASLNTL